MKIYELIVEKENAGNTELQKHYVIGNTKKALFEELEEKGIETYEVLAVNEKKNVFKEEDFVPYILDSGMKEEHKIILIEILRYVKFI